MLEYVHTSMRIVYYIFFSKRIIFQPVPIEANKSGFAGKIPQDDKKKSLQLMYLD